MTPIERLKRRIDLHFQSEMALLDDIEGLRQTEVVSKEELVNLLRFMLNHPHAKKHASNPTELFNNLIKAQKLVAENV